MLHYKVNNLKGLFQGNRILVGKLSILTSHWQKESPEIIISKYTGHLPKQANEHNIYNH